METRETILKELGDISPLVAGIQPANLWAVPAGYFEAFAGQVLARIHTENAVFGDKHLVFSVPQGYFDGFAGTVLDKIRRQTQSVEAELNELAPILNTISREPVYAVPEGYFESLELTIPLKLDKPSARVFSFSKPKRLVQYAVAACTAAVLVIGAFILTGRNASDDMWISYGDATKMNVAQELSKVNEDDIAVFLEQTPSVGYAVNASTEDIDLEDYIETTSDEEIQQYLDESGGNSEEDLNGI